MQPVRPLLLIMFCLSLCAASAHAQRMPQDSWYFSHKWGSQGAGDGEFDLPGNIVIGPDGLVYVLDYRNHRIQVFNQDGTFVRKWGGYGSEDGQFNFGVEGGSLCVSEAGFIFLADRGNHRIQVFEQDGTFVRRWGSYGSSDGQFNSPRAIAVSVEGFVYVSDFQNRRVQYFDQNGAFLGKWGSGGTLDGQFHEGPEGLSVDHLNRIFVRDRDRVQVFGAEGNFIKKLSVGGNGSIAVSPPTGNLLLSQNNNVLVIESDGTSIRSFGGNGTADGRFGNVGGIAISDTGNIFVSDRNNHRIQVFNPADYRVPHAFGLVPQPRVLNVVQRPGTPYLDVDYKVWDDDSTNVTVAAAAFMDGVNSMNNFIKINSFVDGTESAIGSNVLANVTNRFTWNVAADWQAEYVNLKVRMMAQDDRGLMSVGFITLPEDVESSLPALTISQSPITQADMLPLWYWLLATGDASVELNGGAVYGVGGSYDGIMLAQGTTTTATGRTFLFERMGLRQATAAEYDRARMGPSGVVNVWPLRAGAVTAGPGDRPKALNEYGFDTGNWSSDDKWVVQE